MSEEKSIARIPLAKPFLNEEVKEAAIHALENERLQASDSTGKICF